jgi:hypothetical protein
MRTDADSVIMATGKPPSFHAGRAAERLTLRPDLAATQRSFEGCSALLRISMHFVVRSAPGAGFKKRLFPPITHLRNCSNRSDRESLGACGLEAYRFGEEGVAALAGLVVVGDGVDDDFF